MKKRVIVLLAGLAALASTLALAAPIPGWATAGCDGRRACHYEEGTTCPPCYALVHCGPNCGCKAIPNCTS